MTVTPDFARHPSRPLGRAVLGADGMVELTWPDGHTMAAFAVWLYEQTVGIDPVTKEGTVDPSALPDPSDLVAAAVDVDGDLVLRWCDGTVSVAASGWLRHVADGAHLPAAALGRPTTWTAADLREPPTFDGRRILRDPVTLEGWLVALTTFGVARLRAAPTTDGFVGELGARIGPVRGSNFGGVFTVAATAQPDSTANTGLGLGQHTDLPTRETPPGFQLLHCVENTVGGGWSRLTDGLAVVDVLQREHPSDLDALTTLEWVFANRAVDGDHRWTAPIIDQGGPRTPLTIRGFYPVRLAPHMAAADQPRAYRALRTFSAVAHDPRLMITFPFRPAT